MKDDDAGGWPGEWLDMDAYPELDPDRAVPQAASGELRGVLLSHEVAPLADGRWEAALHAAVGTGQPADTAWAGPDGSQADSWWPDPAPDAAIGHYPMPGFHDPADPYSYPESHSDGGHW